MVPSFVKWCIHSSFGPCWQGVDRPWRGICLACILQCAQSFLQRSNAVVCTWKYKNLPFWPAHFPLHVCVELSSVWALTCRRWGRTGSGRWCPPRLSAGKEPACRGTGQRLCCKMATAMLVAAGEGEKKNHNDKSDKRHFENKPRNQLMKCTCMSVRVHSRCKCLATISALKFILLCLQCIFNSTRKIKANVWLPLGEHSRPWTNPDETPNNRPLCKRSQNIRRKVG